MKVQELTKFLSEDSPGFLKFGNARMALLDIEAGFWGIRRQVETLIGSRLTNSVLQQAGANGGASFAESFGKADDVESQGRLFESCLQAYQVAGFGKYEIQKAHWSIGRLKIRAQDTIEAWMMSQHGQQIDGPVCAYTAGVLVGFINVISNRRDMVCIEQRCQALGDDCCEFDLLPASESDRGSAIAFNPDPGLGRQLNLLEMLFERMPMGIAILDREYRIQRYNPTWLGFSERYASPSAVPLNPGAYYFDLLPGTEATVSPLFECALNGEIINQSSLCLESEGVVTYWDVVLAPLFESGTVVGILNVAVDVTEREEARQNLEQRVTDRTRELQVLLDVTAAANSSLDLDDMLSTTLDLLISLVGASRAGVVLKGTTDGQLSTRVLRPKHDVAPDDLRTMLQACEAVIASGEPLYIAPDKRLGFLEPGALLPLTVREEAIGVLAIIGPEGDAFSAQQLALFKSIADQMSVAVENTRLYEQAEQVAINSERNRLARDLHDAVSQTLFSASLIADVLPKLWEQNPEAGKQKLDELRLLTRGALSEMRTLLLELRPDAFQDVDLGDLYRHLGNAFTGRTQIPLKITQEGEPILPLDVKKVFYRIGQEALNNIAKHAGATQVEVSLITHESRVEIHIRDNGCGFETSSLSPENLGLKIMRERVESIQADLEIESISGSGTAIHVYWHTQEEKI